ncbi:MAG: acyltransferase family protein [Rhodomicrobium sp.]
MTQPQKPARDATWDIARGIGMMLVIYGHLLESMYPANPAMGRGIIESAAVQWQVMYSFHMMLFFLVSGAVNRNLPKKAWPDVLRGSLRLLALAWVVHIIGAFFALAAGYAPPDATRSVWDAAVYVIEPILEGYCWSVGVLWFLTSLCCVQFLAYVLLRYFPALIVILAAVAGTAAVVYFDAPNYFLFRTWMPGLAFFALGYLFSQWNVRWPFWLCIPLLAAVIFLAPLNSGCSFSFSGPCEIYGTRPFGIRMFGGSYGFLPLFFLSSLLGSIMIVSLSAGLARFRASAIFAYAGRQSLNLFIINGFVATFLPPYIQQIPWPPLTATMYAGLAVVVIAAHLITLQALKPALTLLDEAAVAIANGLVRLVAGEKHAAASKPA